MIAPTNNSMNNVLKAYEKLSTGLRINKAADDPAGLSISKKLESLSKSLEVGTNNTSDMNNLVLSAEGSMANIGDSLQRMKELSVQASNGTLTDTDRASIQTEIQGLKESINSVAKNTEFNSQKLLDGSFTGKTTETGTGKIDISIDSVATDALGIADFDVTGTFDMDKLDKAISTVSESRSKLGSINNRFTYTMNRNEVAKENTMAANSKIKDADMASEISSLKQNQVLSQYRLSMQKQQTQNQGNVINSIF